MSDPTPSGMPDLVERLESIARDFDCIARGAGVAEGNTIREAVAALRASSGRGVPEGWRHFDSAPKDGDYILARIAGEDRVPVTVAWNAHIAAWSDGDSDDPDATAWKGISFAWWLPLSVLPPIPGAALSPEPPPSGAGREADSFTDLLRGDIGEALVMSEANIREDSPELERIAEAVLEAVQARYRRSRPSAALPQAPAVTEADVERVAQAIEGPHREVPLTSRLTLVELRGVRWANLSAQEQAHRLEQARAAIATLSPSGLASEGAPQSTHQPRTEP